MPSPRRRRAVGNHPASAQRRRRARWPRCAARRSRSGSSRAAPRRWPHGDGARLCRADLQYDLLNSASGRSRSATRAPPAAGRRLAQFHRGLFQPRQRQHATDQLFHALGVEQQTLQSGSYCSADRGAMDSSCRLDLQHGDGSLQLVRGVSVSRRWRSKPVAVPSAAPPWRVQWAASSVVRAQQPAATNSTSA